MAMADVQAEMMRIAACSSNIPNLFKDVSHDLPTDVMEDLFSESGAPGTPAGGDKPAGTDRPAEDTAAHEGGDVPAER
eukprot:5161274-Pyramimonas_sp.AAC.1